MPIPLVVIINLGWSREGNSQRDSSSLSVGRRANLVGNVFAVQSWGLKFLVPTALAGRGGRTETERVAGLSAATLA